MPLTDDVQILDTSKGLVERLQVAAKGPHAGFRPAHAKGRLLTGTFTPTAEAKTLTTAPHFNLPSTSLTLRFSSSTGIPDIPDTDPQSNPRGIAIRFHLPEKNGRRQHTDIIAHSTRYFPTRTGAEFLEFLQAATSPEAGTKVPEFLGRHPETLTFLGDPKPSPESFATERYFGVNAFKFIDASGKGTFVKYQVEPEAGLHTLSEEETKAKGPNYLFEELATRLDSAPFSFKLVAQIGEEGDPTDNATILWPEERKIVELGTVTVEKVKDENESLAEQKKLIFDPIPRVEGVEASDDPLLDVRANVYLVSGRQRREA